MDPASPDALRWEPWGSSYAEGRDGPPLGADVVPGSVITMTCFASQYPFFFAVDDFAAGGPGETGLTVAGDLVEKLPPIRMRGSGSVSAGG